MADSFAFQQCGTYDLADYKKAGQLLIFSHFEYKDNPELRREGTHPDIVELSRVFTALRFDIHVCNDYTYREIRDKLKHYANQCDLHGHGCLVVVVMTHGGHDGLLCARDSCYHVSKVWGPFIKCRALKDKPKIFIFQACRSSGSEAEQRFELACDARLNTPSVLPHAKDFLLAYSTVEGRVSMRDVEHGTWYIQSLCRGLWRFGEGRRDLLTTLTEVTHLVVTEKLHPLHKTGQTPVFVSYLDKLVVSSYHYVIKNHPICSDSPKSSTASDQWRASMSTVVSDDTSAGVQIDAGSGVIAEESLEPEYHLPLAFPGKAIIYHDMAHEDRANQLAAILRSLNFRTEPCKLITADLLNDLDQVATKPEYLENEASLLVAVLASLGESKLKETKILTRDCVETFIGSRCTAMRGKPKLFFFLDSESKSAKLRSDELPQKTSSSFANDHSDFFVLYGYDAKFLGRLFQELESCKERPDQLLRVITRALSCAERSQGGFLSHFESTLTCGFLCGQGTETPQESEEQVQKMICEASRLRSLGCYQQVLDLYTQVVEKRRRMFGENHSDTLRSMYNKAVVLHALGKRDESHSLNEQILGKRLKILGENHRDTLMSMQNTAVSHYTLGQYENALKLYEKVAEKRRENLGMHHKDTLMSLHSQAITLHILGKDIEALPIYDELIENRIKVLGEDSIDTLQSIHNKALSLHAVGNYREALELNEKVLAKKLRILGNDHLDTLQTLHNKALNLYEIGDYNDALHINEQVLEKRRSILGDGHKETMMSMYGITLCLYGLERYEEIIKISTELIKKQEKNSGDEQEDVINSKHIKALALNKLGKFNDALKLHESILEYRTQKLGEEHVDTLMSMHCKAETLHELVRYCEALSLYEKVVEKRTSILGEDHLNTLQSKHEKAVTLCKLGNQNDAMELFKDVYEKRKNKLGEDHIDTKKTEKEINNLNSNCKTM